MVAMIAGMIEANQTQTGTENKLTNQPRSIEGPKESGTPAVFNPTPSGVPIFQTDPNRSIFADRAPK